MVDQHLHSLPSKFNIRDPKFPLQLSLWAAQTRDEIAELVARSIQTVAKSRELIAKIDEILAMRVGPSTRLFVLQFLLDADVVA